MGKIGTLVKMLKSPRLLKSTLMSKFSYSKCSKIVGDKPFLKMQYKAVMGRKLNLKDPKTFNEKLQWLKLYDRNPLYTTLVDKVDAKEYVTKVIGTHCIIPTLGVWDRVEDIEWDNLPDQFVLKCTHDSGSVVICRDKSTFDKEKAIKKLKKKLKSNLFWLSREWPYKNLKPRIIAEEFLSELAEGIIDYKFFCFSGEPRFLYVSQGLENHETARISYVSLDWEQEPFRRTDFKTFEVLPPRPQNFDQMIEYSKKLSNSLPFMRVDFYEVKGKVYFSEMTFYPGAGLTEFAPDGWDEKIGDMIDLSLAYSSQK